MGTYDGYWEMNYNSNNNNSSNSGYDAYSNRSGYSGNQSKNEVKKEQVPFQPIVSASINTYEWKAAKQGVSTDCSIIFGDQIFTVHKFKLMIHSKYFKDQIQGQMNVTEIKCDGIDPKVLKVLLKFLYLGAISKHIQLDIMDGKMDLLEIMSKAHEFGIKGLSEWSEPLLSSYLGKFKISSLKYSEWFSLACQENSISLFRVLLNGTQANCNHVLINAINKASMSADITKENWTTLKEAAKTLKVADVALNISSCLVNCETYNPIIKSALES
jgi:hypothetical protein